MSTKHRQTWDEPNYKKMWVAFLKSHPGIHVNSEALALEMGASKRSVEDQFKALRREARALQTPADAASMQDGSDVVDEEDLNVYQRAKRGLSPRGTRQNRGGHAAAKGGVGVEKAVKRSRPTLPEQEAGAEEEAKSSIGREQQKSAGDDSEEEDGEDDGMVGGATGSSAK